MPKYSVTSDVSSVEVIQRVNDDGTIDSIPSDPANMDYLKYLASLQP